MGTGIEFIEFGDLNVLAKVGSAFWIDSELSKQATADAVSAASLMDFDHQGTLEKAASALLSRARRDGFALNAQTNIAVIENPFFRLNTDQRFILVCLHLANWSYARIGRIMNLSRVEVEQLAWNARMTLLTELNSKSKNAIAYPIGSKKTGSHCPEYDSSRPWTQRFMDEEIQSGGEQFFLQNHLMACDDCRKAISSCREAYYSIEKALPELDSGKDFIYYLYQVHRTTYGYRRPASRTFAESLAVFLSRRDTLWTIGIGILVIYLLSRH